MKTGIALALAWPETYCKQAGAWYDSLLLKFGINTKHYYRAGHAALILLEKQNPEIYYYDFGRYHAPFGHGRVRSAKSDPDLILPILAEWSQSGKLLNTSQILQALNSNPAYHGDGILYSSSFEIDFQSAQRKALEMQNNSPIPYGPFTYGGSNCSRFVNQVLRQAKPGFIHLIRLHLPWTLTPSPMSNVRSGTLMVKDGSLSQKRIPDSVHVGGTLLAPALPEFLKGHNPQWLSGEGAGSWFTIKEFFGDYLIHRYTPDGQVEFGGLYGLIVDEQRPNLEDSFRFEYLSHFQSIQISQANCRYHFTLKASQNINVKPTFRIEKSGDIQRISH